MTTHDDVVSALNALEGTVGSFSIGSCAYIRPDDENLSEEAVGVFKAISELGGRLCYEETITEQLKLAGTDYRININRLTGQRSIVTRAGIIEIPEGIQLALTYKF